MSPHATVGCHLEQEVYTPSNPKTFSLLDHARTLQSEVLQLTFTPASARDALTLQSASSLRGTVFFLCRLIMQCVDLASRLRVFGVVIEKDSALSD